MINIDMNKAKEIGHGIRRANREAEFASLDKLATIPPYSIQAEEQRQGVRTKYIGIQEAIEAAETPDEIKTALGLV